MKSLFDSIFAHNSTGAPAAVTTTTEPEVATSGGAINPLMQQDIATLSHLDERSTQVITAAYQEAKRLRKSLIETEQLLFGLLSDREVFTLLEQFQVDIASLVRELQNKESPGTFSGEPTLSEQVKQFLEQAYTSAKKRNVDFMTPEDILLAIFGADLPVMAPIKNQGVDKAKIEQKLTNSPEFKTGKKSFLKEFGVDLVEQAKAGKLDPISGRDNEIQRLVHILLRRTKNNPIIIGEAGVGKTAIVEGLAQMIAAQKVPPDLANKKIIQLDVSSLVAGASHRGEFEERLQNLIREAMASSGQIILFIDEIHTLIGAGDTGGALDASNIIKPYLSRGQLQVIGTTTTAEYRKYFEKDRAFERRFQAILCPEPSEEEAIKMIQVLQPKYEAFHKVTFPPETLQAAVHLSKRYIGERFLPDKAIDLMDEAASEVRLNQATGKRADNQVKDTDIQNVVSRWTGIPIAKLTEKESDKLLHLEDLIHKKFINHSSAVKAVAEAVRRGRIGLANANRPIASFIFLGPTGTGKTELAKVLAEIMFGKPDAMIRLDMSEYMEKHEVAKLVGAPPGYVGYEEGGQLTEAVRAKPYSIVLLDEVEKAHPDVFNILLQLLEDGRLTDNKGNTISFKNTIIIATSNIGSDLIREKLQGQKDIGEALRVGAADRSSKTLDARPQTSKPESAGDVFKEITKLVMEQLNKFFKPELLNRFDEIVIFEPLSQENMVDITRLAIENTRKMLKEQDVDLQLSQAALAQLAKDGYDPVYGARPLRRLVQREIENPIAIYLINKTIQKGETIIVDYNPSQDKFSFSKSAAPAVGAAPVSTAPTLVPTLQPVMVPVTVNPAAPIVEPSPPTPPNPALQNVPSVPGVTPPDPTKQ